MIQIDWKTKLTSRKLWIAIAGLVIGILKAFESGAPWSTQVGGLVMAFGSVIGYLLAEGLVDAASAGSDIYIDSTTPEETDPP